MAEDTSEVVEAFSLRIPTTLRARIRRSAQSNRRSINSQIIVLLERALPAEEKKVEAVAAASAE